MEEIKEINQRLIDTVVEISDDEDADDPSEGATACKGCEGTTVRFLFKAVSLGPSLKAHLLSTQMVSNGHFVKNLFGGIEERENHFIYLFLKIMSCATVSYSTIASAGTL